MAIVGEAEVLVVANTKAFEAQLATLGDASGAGLAAKSGAAGEDAGLALASGLSVGAKGIGEDVTEDVEKQTSKMKGLFEDVGKKASSSLSSIGVPASLLSGWKAGGLAIAAVGAVSIKLASDMQTADASIATSAGESVKAATSIGDAFLSTAGKSEYSGIKQAQAFAQVAGQLKTTEGQALTTAQAMTFMKSSTDLATASGEDLASTTSTLSGAMQAFQIPVEGAASAANVLFNAGRATGQSLETLASSVERVKGRLGDLSPSLSALSALMVDLTKNGITSRGATTALQGSYTALAGAATGTSKANLLAKQTLADYGIQVVNTAGQLTPMSTIIQKLAPQFATMTQQQQLATATNIFGASAAKQMTAVIDAGTQSYNNATQAVTKNNAVTDAAAIKQHTLSGEVDTLKSAVSDEAVNLGSVLVPALTAVAGAVLPVVTDFIKLISWFEQGSAPAKTIAIAIGAVLAPALLKMGADAATSAAKAVASFVTMSGSAQATATSIAGSETEASTAVEGFGTTVEATNDAVISSNAEVAASFTGLAGKAGAAGVVIAGLYDTYTSIKNPSQIGQGGLLDAVLGNGQTVEGRNTDTSKMTTIGIGKNGQDIVSVSEKQLTAVNDLKNLTQKQGDALLTKFANLDKDRTKNAPQIEALLQTLLGPGSTTGSIRGLMQATTESKCGKDSYINPTGSSSVLSSLTSKFTEALALPVGEAITSLKALGVPAAEAGKVLKDASLPFGEAIKALEKLGFDATDAVQIAEDATRKSTSSAKSAATKAEEDAKKSAAAATKAQTTLTSEVLKAVTLPSSQAAKQLEALGVPANKATQVLHDAVEPFTDAVKALEKAGFDASNAVKIADAGQKVVQAEAKAAAEAAKKAGDNAANLKGLTVNGIQVAGSVYDAAIGSAMAQQIGSNTAGGGINIHPGAIVINPSPGNDSASLLATKNMVDQAIQELTSQLTSGTSPLGATVA